MENVSLDPLAGLSPELPEGTTRDHAAALVKGGAVTLDAANAALTARGAAPLAANSREVAEIARAALLNDSAFTARYGHGDPEAIAKLFQADLRVQQTSGKLTDRPAIPGDYDLRVAPHMPDAPPAEVLTYGEELSKLAASVQLPKASAQALVDDHFAAVSATAGMSAEEQGQYAQQETAALHQALGPKAEERMKAASIVLTKTSGRNLDLAKIVASNGASVALTLLHQAEVLGQQKGKG
jgi:hypothetical protein